MPSQKVRKQLIFVNATRRRLQRILVENGDDPGESGGKKRSSFLQMVEELQRCIADVREVRQEVDKLSRGQRGTADGARLRQDLRRELQRGKGILQEMRESLQPIKRSLDKALRKGKDDTTSYQQKLSDYQSKQSMIDTLVAELDKLGERPEMEMNAADAGNLKEGQDMMKALRRARREDVMKGALEGEEGGPAGPSDPNDDPEFDERMKQIEKNKKATTEALLNLSKGIGALKERALVIGQQIDQSNERLDDAQGRADTNMRDLKALNKATLRAIDEASNSSYLTNIACMMLLIALIGVTVYYLDLV